MRLFVRDCVSGVTFVVPCNDSSGLVGSLKEKIIARFRGEKEESGFESVNYTLTLAGSEAILNDKDVIDDVLQDGDFVTLVGTKIEGTVDGFLEEDTSTLPSYHHSICQALSNGIKKAQWIELDGKSLSIEDLMKIGQGKYRVKLSESAVDTVNKSRTIVDEFVQNHKVVYGITTGFGKFARVSIPDGKLIELQEQLIRSHAAGVGPPLPPDQVRRLLALRINVLAKGFSGVRMETIKFLLSALNASCLPYIPLKGTVGASGDLAPLSHLALGMMGEGRMWNPSTGWGQARDVLKSQGLEEIKLAPKEGLALINGTQFITAIGSEAVHRAELIAKQSDVIGALSLEVLQGTPRAFDYEIHANRPHPGQQLVAARLRALLDSNVHPSQIRGNHIECGCVQDPYTMRCIPQVHGVVNDTIDFVKGIITTEINSALDNPMVLTGRRDTISGGNFHGEYPAKALDYLAIGIHELANLSERRQERLVNPAYSNLPAFLVRDGGLNSGFMIAHCTSAALVSENKVLTHPSSADTISTSAGTEDHVSMGGFAARKALEVIKHVEQVLAIELLAACQGMEFHRPRKTTAPLEEVYKLVRSVVKPWDKDRYFAPDIEASTRLLREGKVWEAVESYVNNYTTGFVQVPTLVSSSSSQFSGSPGNKEGNADNHLPIQYKITTM